MWQFIGDDFYIDYVGGSQFIYYDDWGSLVYLDKGMVFLNVVILFDMLVGEYDIILDVIMQLGINKMFFYYQDEYNVFLVDCIIVMDFDDFCFVSLGFYVLDMFIFSVNSGFIEIVWIMERVENVFVLVMLGLWVIVVLFIICCRCVKQ